MQKRRSSGERKNNDGLQKEVKERRKIREMKNND